MIRNHENTCNYKRFISHVIACCITAFVVINIGGIRLERDFRVVGSSASLVSTYLPAATANVIQNRLNCLNRQQHGRIDFYACLGTNRTIISPVTSPKVGMGHKCHEVFYSLWVAITQGYCICLTREIFREDFRVYELLLQSFLPLCPADFEFYPSTFTKVSDLYRYLNYTSYQASNTSVIYRLFADWTDIWPPSQFLQQRRGHGDLLVFIERLFKDNQLMETQIYPHYLCQKSIPSAFSNATLRKNVSESRFVTAAFHVRTGDLHLHSSKLYWYNLLTALCDIVRFEFGSEHMIHIYWLYFRATHWGRKGRIERIKLSLNRIGEWPSKPGDLPLTHEFIAELCDKFETIQCFWKSGTNMDESIDLMVESEVIYVSGSSFSQILSLFQKRQDGIKLIGTPKELQLFQEADPNIFLQTHTSSLNSVRNYHVNMVGKLHSEQFAFLRMKEPHYTNMNITLT